MAAKVERYVWGDSILVIHLALSNPLEFRAGEETGRACYVHCTPPSREYVAQMFTEARAGLLPAGPVAVVCNDYAADPSRVPSGRGLIKILVKCVPYRILGTPPARSARRHGTTPRSPTPTTSSTCSTKDTFPTSRRASRSGSSTRPSTQQRLVSTAVHRTELQGAFVPYQSGAMRPIPELGGYRSPVANLYLCGSSSHPGPGVSFMPGRNAARVIGNDLGLDRPP